MRVAWKLHRRGGSVFSAGRGTRTIRRGPRRAAVLIDGYRSWSFSEVAVRWLRSHVDRRLSARAFRERLLGITASTSIAATVLDGAREFRVHARASEVGFRRLIARGSSHALLCCAYTSDILRKGRRCIPTRR